MSPDPRRRRLHFVSSRHCPSCGILLRPVAGSRGRMGNCVGCGYTGPLRRPDPDDAA